MSDHLDAHARRVIDDEAVARLAPPRGGPDRRQNPAGRRHDDIQRHYKAQLEHTAARALIERLAAEDFRGPEPESHRLACEHLERFPSDDDEPPIICARCSAPLTFREGCWQSADGYACPNPLDPSDDTHAPTSTAIIG
jgi:hypothetical protein